VEDSTAGDALESLRPLIKPEKYGEAKQIIMQVVSKSHSGPIPSADELEHLERITPGLADRVVAMAEKEQDMRHGTTRDVVTKEFALRGRGQFFALIALFALLAVVCYIAYLGDPKNAMLLGIGTIGAVVAIFVTGRWFDSSENETDGPSNDTTKVRNNNQKSLPKNNKPKRR
jgi:uncharacterized membrane protein